MTLLVTGATGLVGSHVVEHALARGLRVRALVRPASPGREELRALGVDEAVGVLGDEAALLAACRGAEAVVHCAATVGDWGSAALYEETNVAGVRRLLHAAHARNVRRFVLISSLGVYPPRDHDGTDETTPPCLDGFDPYVRSKARGEVDAVATAATLGLPLTVLRPGFVYGARDRHVLPGLIRALRTKLFTHVDHGLRPLDHTYARNVADAVFLALQAPRAVGQVYNVMDDPVVDRRTFVGAVAARLGLPPPTRSMPRWLARPLAYAMDRSWRLAGAADPPPLSLARYKFLGLGLRYSIAKAKEEIGYQPRYTFETGLDEALRWFLEREQG
jgi:nucleoside-diphosphate-sugar epimerase